MHTICPATLVPDFTYYIVLRKMDKKFTIYLSSTSYSWWNKVSYNWKRTFMDACHEDISEDVQFIDPLQVKSEDPEICVKDINDITRSDFVVVYLDKITIGTMMELCLCMYYGIKEWCILTFNPDVYNHPWLVKFADSRIFTSYENCVKFVHLAYIRKFFGPEKENTPSERRFG